jgi:beta-mannosidase
MLRTTTLHYNWRFAQTSWDKLGRIGYSFTEWLPARVPGHVHLDLVENGVIGHPFERMQELGCQWVDEQDFSYKTTFEWHPDPSLPERVLRFQGLDTVCRVFLNGELVAEHDNMFVPLEVPVRDKLRDGENELRIDFASAVRTGLERRAKYAAEEGLAETFERLEERSFVRKVQCMFGWDWGPRLVSCGIWRPVELIEYVARLLDVYVRQSHRGDGKVELVFESRVEGDAGVVHVIEGVGVRRGDGTFVIEEPVLWQPAGFGEPHLYRVTTFVVPAGFDVASVPEDPARALSVLSEVALDRKLLRIGLRTVRLVREKDRFGESFEFEVNGQRLYALGANFIPDHSFPSTISAGQYRARIEAALRSGMNMLRVWGGGLYESDDFYDVCDELGILVWQDFAFGCAYYPDTGAWKDVVRREAECNVVRLRNHPSLVLWCGNNENLMMWVAKWGDETNHPPRYLGEHLYDEVLPEVLGRLDQDRPYIPSSPFGGEDPNGGGEGDQHYWDVWHGRGDWVFYRESTARFASEYGFASSPSLRAWREVFRPGRAFTSADLPVVEESELRGGVRDPIVRWHDKTLKGYETFLGYVWLHYPESTKLEDWVYYSQLNQRDAIRAAIEHFRRSEFCKGSLIWQLNDCWPVQSWALIDSLGQPKVAWFELSRLHAPLLVSLDRKGEDLGVWVIADNAPGRAFDGKLELEVVSLSTGEVHLKRVVAVSLANGERRRVLELSTAGLSRDALVVASFEGATATSLLVEPKELALQPPAPLDVSLAGDGELAIFCPKPLVDLVFWDEQGTEGFAKNAITTSRPGVVRVGYRGQGRGLRARSLAGEHALRVTRAKL